MQNIKQQFKVKHYSSQGFSLLETMVAISILITAVTGPLSLASQSIFSASLSKNNIIAANLSQEGLELVWNIKASNILNSKYWTYNFSPCFGPNGCLVNPEDGSISPCGASCDPLRFNNLNGRYGYSSGSITLFIRQIRIETLNSNEIKVRSIVSWSERLANRSIIMEEYLFNWL